MSALKDMYNENTVRQLAAALRRVHRSFPEDRFFRKVLAHLPELELKTRVVLMATTLQELLPADPAKSFPILVRALAPEADRKNKDAGIREGVDGFLVWPLTHYVQVYGLNHFDLSMAALKEMTKRFTAEFAVRPFLVRYESQALDLFSTWAESECHHVRRLVSEGTRPRLPWGERLSQFCANPSLTLPLLEKLRHDPEDYVQRSVANHLNDISKDHPQVVVKTLHRWLNEAPEENSAAVEWIARHATRTLVKKGDPKALRLFGVNPSCRIDLDKLSVSPKKIREGESIEFDFRLTSKESKSQKLVIDYAIHHMRANGECTAKVFKHSKKTLTGRSAVSLNGRHSFKPISTRRYYPGRHSLEILVNGRSLGKTDFQLLPTAATRPPTRKGRAPVSRR